MVLDVMVVFFFVCSSYCLLHLVYLHLVNLLLIINLISTLYIHNYEKRPKKELIAAAETNLHDVHLTTIQ